MPVVNLQDDLGQVLLPLRLKFLMQKVEIKFLMTSKGHLQSLGHKGSGKHFGKGKYLIPGMEMLY